MHNWSFFIFIIYRLIPETRQVISLSFFLSFFLYLFIYLYIFFKSFLVLWFFSLSVNKQNSDTFLIFFWRHFNLPIWAGLGKIAYSSHHRHVCLLRGLLANWLVWFFLFLDSTFLLPRIGLIGQWASSLQIVCLLLGTACQFIHPY